jgi:hypothetical protein
MRDLDAVSKGVRSSSSPVEAFRCKGFRRRVVRGEGGSEPSASCPAMMEWNCGGNEVEGTVSGVLGKLQERRVKQGACSVD